MALAFSWTTVTFGFALLAKWRLFACVAKFRKLFEISTTPEITFSSIHPFLPPQLAKGPQLFSKPSNFGEEAYLSQSGATLFGASGSCPRQGLLLWAPPFGRKRARLGVPSYGVLDGGA